MLTTLGQNFQPGASNNPLYLNYWMTIVAMAKKFVKILQSLSDNITLNYYMINTCTRSAFGRIQKKLEIEYNWNLEDFGFYSKNSKIKKGNQYQEEIQLHTGGLILKS